MHLTLAFFLSVLPPVSSNAPERQPGLAVDGKTIALVSGAAGSILVRVSRDAGAWPTAVALGDGSVVAAWERDGRVALDRLRP
jgi:hypothetical protein